MARFISLFPVLLLFPLFILDGCSQNYKDCVKDDVKSGKTFCTKVNNYPEKSHLDEIIKTKFSKFEALFIEDFIQPENISNRTGNEPPIEEFLCRSRTRLIYPELGLNSEGKWKYIVNTKTYKQGLRIEQCTNEGAICGEESGLTLPNSYEATCKQNYIYRTLVVIEEGETIALDQLRIPSCCKCVLKRTLD